MSFPFSDFFEQNVIKAAHRYSVQECDATMFNQGTSARTINNFITNRIMFNYSF